MSGSVQKRSLQRKLIYSGLIVGILSLTLVVRKADFAIGSTQVRGILPQAKALELREEDMGEADLLSSTLLLTFTGSRGLVVCGLWWNATDLQMRNEWNELDQHIRLITKLQPHFITPWRFQSWNLAYNVSVEPDSNIDKYFYITRGMQLLAKGQGRNKDNPNLRYDLGFFFQDKFGMADESNTFRSLLELSCMDPLERSPARFMPDAARPDQVDWGEFEKFCTAHPFLVRRLREQLYQTQPREIVRFLDDARKIPSLYEDRTDETQGPTPLKQLADEQFPILPPRSNFGGDDEPVRIGMGEIPYYLANNFAFARAWYEYAQDPLYLTPPHMPHYTLGVFRPYPARAQAFIAERLEKEGWFDLDGWKVSDWFPVDPSSPRSSKRTVTFGTDHDRPWASEAWERAYQMYETLGRDTEDGRFMGFNLPPEKLARLSPETRQRYVSDRQTSNYEHWLGVSEFSRIPASVRARKKFAEAKKHMHVRLNALALRDFEDPDAFGPPSTWPKQRCTGLKRLLLDPSHAIYRNDLDEQENLYKLQEQYLKIFRAVRQDRINSVKFTMEAMARAATPSVVGQVWQPSLVLGEADEVALTLQGPFDDLANDGKPFISAEVLPHPDIPGHVTPEQAKAMLKKFQRQKEERQRHMMEQERETSP